MKTTVRYHLTAAEWPSLESLQKINAGEGEEKTGKAWGQEKNGTIEDEMVGWHQQLNGQEFEQTLGDGEGQGSLVCCSP